MNAASKISKADKGNKRKATRVQRACSNCRKRKQGCEEERPCRRCVEKGIDCVEVEPKRKKGGRVKTHTHRSRQAGTRDRSNEEMPDYDEEDDAEDNFPYESEGEGEDSYLSSEEDQAMISPRGNSSNTSTASSKSNVTTSNKDSTTMNSSSGNVMVPHTIKLNLRNSGSNTSSSNLHTTFSQHSHSHANGECNHSHSHSLPRSRSHSLSSNTPPNTVNSFSSDQTSPPDSPNPGDVNDEVDNVDYDEPFYMDDVMEPIQRISHRGLCLSLLLPFIGNMSGTPSEETQNDNSPMFVDEDYNYLFESESQIGGNTSNSSLLSQSNTANTTGTLIPLSYQKSQNSMELGELLQQKILGSSLPFHTNSFSNKGNSNDYIEDGDSRAQIYIKECWEEFQYKNLTKSYDMEIQRVSESWKEIMKCLRNLEWHKAQSLMQEMEEVNGSIDYFGENTQPSFVMWSSGGRIHHANESFCKLVGYSLEELRVEVSAEQGHGNHGQMSAHSFFHPEEMMKILKRQLVAVQSGDRSGSCYQMNTRLLSKTRLEIPVSCSVLNLRDNQGPSSLTVAIFV